MPDFPIPFAKMSGTGNDFVLIDNRRTVVPPGDLPRFASLVCRRTQSVGADGLILIQEDPELDFSWRFFNADGSEAEMCGNGSRCAARFAFLEGIAGPLMTFRTLAGPIQAEVSGSSVKVQLTPPRDLTPDFVLPLEGQGIHLGSVDTGVPHAVIILPPGALDRTPLEKMGKTIRFHPRFAPAGTNVNFVEVTGPASLRVRTYERGVEGETQACGTGSVASALIAIAKGLVSPPVAVLTRGGESLSVDIEDPTRVFLEGAARMICRGELLEEALNGGTP